MKTYLALAIIATAIVVTVIPLAAISRAQIGNEIPAAANNHLPVKTVQDEHFIVTTVTKNNTGVPSGPIIIIPPNNETGGNGTILTPGDNGTVIIEPGGNVTELPSDSNITHEGNDTVIVTPPDRNVTEIPDNITVIGPPAHNETSKPCECQNQTVQPPVQTIPPVIVSPAPGQNVTTLPHPEINNTLPAEPVQPPFQPPAENQSNNQPAIPPAENNTNGGLQPAHPIFIPPSESNNTAGNNQTGNQSGFNDTPKVNPLTPAVTAGIPWIHNS